MTERNSSSKARFGITVAVFAAAVMLAGSFAFIALQSDDDVFSQEGQLGAATPLDWDMVITKNPHSGGHIIEKVDQNVAGDISLIGIKDGSIDIKITAIGPGAFDGCDKITSIELGPDVQIIGSEAFNDCANLKSIRITTPGSGLLVLENDVFLGCSSISAIIIDIPVITVDSVIGDSTPTPSPETWDLLFERMRSGGGLEIMLGESVLKVETDAFSNYTVDKLWLPERGSIATGTGEQLILENNIFSVMTPIDWEVDAEHFKGWYPVTAGVIGTTKIVGLYGDDGTVTLCPVWKQGYNVTYKDGHGKSYTIMKVDGETFAISSGYNGSFSVEGKTITGWKIEGSSAVHPGAYKYTMQSGDVAFVAVWGDIQEPVENSYTTIAIGIAGILVAVLAAFLIVASKKH
jgi:hypothetical protein